MRGDKTLTLTTSEINSFRSCRRKYYFEYIRNLKPIKTEPALRLGSLYHLGIETLLKTKNLAEATCAMLEEVKQGRELDELLDSDDLFTYYTAENMLKAWAEQSGWQDLEILEVEKKFCVPLCWGVILRGKIDAVCRNKADGKVYILEHKTTAQWGTDGALYMDRLAFADQPINYLLAMRHMKLNYGTPVGVYYDIIEKPTIKPYLATPEAMRKYKADGTLIASQHRRDEMPIEFAERLTAWYTQKPRLHSTVVVPTEQRIEDHLQTIRMIKKDMVTANRRNLYYRNPDHCRIGGCPFACKCLHDSAETDCLFTEKTSKHEELTNETL